MVGAFGQPFGCWFGAGTKAARIPRRIHRQQGKPHDRSSQMYPRAYDEEEGLVVQTARFQNQTRANKMEPWVVESVSVCGDDSSPDSSWQNEYDVMFAILLQELCSLATEEEISDEIFNFQNYTTPYFKTPKLNPLLDKAWNLQEVAPALYEFIKAYDDAGMDVYIQIVSASYLDHNNSFIYFSTSRHQDGQSKKVVTRFDGATAFFEGCGNRNASLNARFYRVAPLHGPTSAVAGLNAFSGIVNRKREAHNIHHAAEMSTRGLPNLAVMTQHNHAAGLEPTVEHAKKANQIFRQITKTIVASNVLPMTHSDVRKKMLECNQLLFGVGGRITKSSYFGPGKIIVKGREAIAAGRLTASSIHTGHNTNFLRFTDQLVYSKITKLQEENLMNATSVREYNPETGVTTGCGYDATKDVLTGTGGSLNFRSGIDDSKGVQVWKSILDKYIPQWQAINASDLVDPADRHNLYAIKVKAVVEFHEASGGGWFYARRRKFIIRLAWMDLVQRFLGARPCFFTNAMSRRMFENNKKRQVAETPVLTAAAITNNNVGIKKKKSSKKSKKIS